MTLYSVNQRERKNKYELQATQQIQTPYELAVSLQIDIYLLIQPSSFVQPQYNQLYSSQIPNTPNYVKEFPQNTTTLQGNTSGYNMMTQPECPDSNFTYDGQQYQSEDSGINMSSIPTNPSHDSSERRIDVGRLMAYDESTDVNPNERKNGTIIIY